MADPQQATRDMITNLEKARKMALGDSALYSQIVPSVLHLIGPGAALDLRRWGADFLAEAFSCPTLASELKEQMCLQVLNLLKRYLEASGEDSAVIKSVVITATSIYPLVFKHTIFHPADNQTWQTLSAVKSNILKRMDKEPAGIRVCCVKFIQRVVFVQTPGAPADPRNPDHNEISLAIVPRDHPLIITATFEAETLGLLDRLLSVFQESSSDALIVTATLNSIGVLVRSRPSIANRILNVILSFNPFRIINGTVTPRIKVNAKSMEKTVRALLFNLMKRMPNHPYGGRVQGYLDRLQQQRAEFFDPSSRKRPAPEEPTDGLDANKRQRLGAELPSQPTQFAVPPPLSPGPVSFAQLFTLTQEPSQKSFDVQAIPFDLVQRIVVPILGAVRQEQLEHAMNIVRTRYAKVLKPPPTTAATAIQQVTGQPQPSFPPTLATEQLYNRLENAPPASLALAQQPQMSLGPYIIPQPPPLSNADVFEYGNGAINRVFESLSALDDITVKGNKPSFNRRAGSNQDRESWVTVVARLATRSLTGLEGGNSAQVKQEVSTTFSLSNTIRDAIHLYVIGDFRKRIDLAISWLTEEWYNDQLHMRSSGAVTPSLTYERLVLKLIDALVPYLDAKDQKILIRFLSEIPQVNKDILERIKRLARDPERVPLAVNSIYYLILFRPPVRDICIDAVEDLYRNYADAKANTTKLLQKWRPQVLQAAQPEIKVDTDVKNPAVSATPAIAA